MVHSSHPRGGGVHLAGGSKVHRGDVLRGPGKAWPRVGVVAGVLEHLGHRQWVQCCRNSELRPRRQPTPGRPAPASSHCPKPEGRRLAGVSSVHCPPPREPRRVAGVTQFAHAARWVADRPAVAVPAARTGRAQPPGVVDNAKAKWGAHAAYWCAMSTAPMLLALLGLIGPIAPAQRTSTVAVAVAPPHLTVDDASTTARAPFWRLRPRHGLQLDRHGRSLRLRQPAGRSPMEPRPAGRSSLCSVPPRTGVSVGGCQCVQELFERIEIALGCRGEGLGVMNTDNITISGETVGCARTFG